MALRNFCAAALLALATGSASAASFGGHGGGLPSGGAFTALSPSPSTVYATWTTGGAGNSVVNCGLAPGAYSSGSQTDAGAETSVTSHTGMVAGLVPSTLYYCQGISVVSGTAQYVYGTVTTTAFPTATSITGVTFGSPVQNSAVQPSTAYIAGDSWFNFTSDDGITYVTADDNTGWNDVYVAGGGSAMSIGKFTSLGVPLTGASINRLSAYGGQSACGVDNLSPKEWGLVSHGGVLYTGFARNWQINAPGCTGPPPGPTPPANTYPSFAAGILKSADKGVTWCNWQGACNTNGVQVSPLDSTMFADIYTFIAPSFLVYGADDDSFSCPRVDNCDAYLYIVSQDVGWTPDNNTYLARIPWARLPNLAGGDIQFWTGGDGTYDGAWSSSSAVAKPLFTNTGKLGAEPIFYVPRLNYYITFQWAYTTPGNVSDATWLTYSAPHPWGSWTLVDTTRFASQGFYMPQPLHSTLLAGGTAPLTLLTGGFDNATDYNIWKVPAQLKCGGSNC